ncbi:MAG: hypothetical protein ACC726_10565 [Chloroflexota bacterium]
MTTKERTDSAALIERYRQIVSRPLELVLDDAVAYWLEDDAGHRLGPESHRSLAPLFLALELTQAGRDPDDLLLCARLDTGERFELGGGPSLIGAAEAAAGIPARPRTVTS